MFRDTRSIIPIRNTLNISCPKNATKSHSSYTYFTTYAPITQQVRFFRRIQYKRTLVLTSIKDHCPIKIRPVPYTNFGKSNIKCKHLNNMFYIPPDIKKAVFSTALFFYLFQAHESIYSFRSSPYILIKASSRVLPYLSSSSMRFMLFLPLCSIRLHTISKDCL